MAQEGTFNFEDCPERCFIEESHSYYLQLFAISVSDTSH